MPKYYEEDARIKDIEGAHNKYALDLELEFLYNRYINEVKNQKLDFKYKFFDRCIYEDRYIFIKGFYKMNKLT